MTTATSPVVTSTVSPVLVSGATAPRTLSVQQTLNPLAGPGVANTGVVTLHSVAPAAATGGTTAATVLLQTSKPLTTSVPNTVAAVSLQPENPVVSGAAVTLAIPSATFGEASATPLCLPSAKPAITSAGTKADKPAIGTPVQIVTQPSTLLPQAAGIPQTAKVKQLVSTISFLQKTVKTRYTSQICLGKILLASLVQ
jgi:transcription initiation factor TFIID subunit 4